MKGADLNSKDLFLVVINRAANNPFIFRTPKRRLYVLFWGFLLTGGWQNLAPGSKSNDFIIQKLKALECILTFLLSANPTPFKLLAFCV